VGELFPPPPPPQAPTFDMDPQYKEDGEGGGWGGKWGKERDPAW
jgi:hypothetical protein